MNLEYETGMSCAEDCCGDISLEVNQKMVRNDISAISQTRMEYYNYGFITSDELPSAYGLKQLRRQYLSWIELVP